jgi:1-acyl-sn-glycerol-3-phosphate acyltransferase
MKASADFLPAIESPTVQVGARLLFRPMLRVLRGVQRVEIASADVRRLQALRHERVVLTPNHPTNTDPALMFELSRHAGMPFHYLCCREAFDGWNGWWGALIQRVGAYSVVRGTADRASFAFTRELLARPGAKLVIFPEGEVYSQNDSLLPFQSGALQLALWGREAARKQQPDAQVFLLPCALHYRFVRDVRPTLCRKLSRLERRLNLPPGPQSLYPRLRRVAVVVFEAVEREYGLAPAPRDDFRPDNDLTPRILAAKEAALTRAAQLLSVEQPRGTLPDRMRALLHVAESEMHEHEKPLNEGECDMPSPVQRKQQERIRMAWRDLQRVANFIALHDGYVAQAPGQERIAEVLYRLEVEVFGRASYAGVRVGRVRIGEPMPLPEKAGRRDLPALTLQLEQSVAALLH